MFSERKSHNYSRPCITDIIVAFLQVALVTKLEERAMDLLAKRTELLVERRRQDCRDQADEVTQSQYFNSIVV